MFLQAIWGSKDKETDNAYKTEKQNASNLRKTRPKIDSTK